MKLTALEHFIFKLFLLAVVVYFFVNPSIFSGGSIHCSPESDGIIICRGLLFTSGVYIVSTILDKSYKE